MTNKLMSLKTVTACWQFLLRRLRIRYINKYAKVSFSQEGEDLLLRRIFENIGSGFYIDIGAHHPHRFSNTHIFYQLGWRGINIEPNPEIYDLFKKKRSHDINIQKGVSTQAGKLTYYMFNEAALNTFDGDLAHEYENETYKIKKEVLIDVCRLDDLLDENLPDGVTIDFMSVDVEGHDLSVLKSNDWEKYRPKILLVEILGFTLARVSESEEHQYLEAQGYEITAKTVNTYLYSDKRIKV